LRGALSSCGGTVAARIRAAYAALLEHFGAQHWWPGDTVWEIMAGAVLTQRTAWANAELALGALRRAGALDCDAIAGLPAARLERLVRSAGFYRSKARTLKALARGVAARGGPEEFLRGDASDVRERLLALPGIGRETSDAIALYAGGHPLFVVDAYTVRYATRHGLAAAGADYETLRSLFQSALGRDCRVLGECHALLVQLGKTCCRPDPLCDVCPLAHDLPEEGPLALHT